MPSWRTATTEGSPTGTTSNATTPYVGTCSSGSGKHLPKNGETVAAFEREFAQYTGAKYCIALCNGTATLHTALVALGVKPGDRVAVPPLTMSSTTIAVLHAGAVPVFTDVWHDTWIMNPQHLHDWMVPVSLYGLHNPNLGPLSIDDAAQTLRKHSGAAFTSYSFQASKILSCGEGGALVTNDEALATAARQFSSLGYDMRPDQPRIDPNVLKSPTFARHHSLGWNYRMADVQASYLLWSDWDKLKAKRQAAASMYREAIQGCSWLTPQHVPEGWSHDYWAYSVALQNITGSMAGTDLSGEPAVWEEIVRRIVKHGGERPYAAWLPVYKEPFYLSEGVDLVGTCPVAESLQPRLMQFQTNDLPSAERNAKALSLAIREIGG